MSVKNIMTEGCRVTMNMVPTGARRTDLVHMKDESHVYFGEFTKSIDGKDLRHGKGVYVGNDFICEGNWVKGRMDGYGRKIYQSG